MKRRSSCVAITGGVGVSRPASSVKKRTQSCPCDLIDDAAHRAIISDTSMASTSGAALTSVGQRLRVTFGQMKGGDVALRAAGRGLPPGSARRVDAGNCPSRPCADW